jgi:hypothetical protein
VRLEDFSRPLGLFVVFESFDFFITKFRRSKSLAKADLIIGSVFDYLRFA